MDQAVEMTDGDGTKDGQPVRVSLVNLGCPKNQVDAEVMLGQLAAAGYQIEEAPERADLIVVNTCSFIQDAKEESIRTILEAAALKRTGRCQAVVVSGCLAQRYGQELPALLPEVDAFVGTGEFPRIADIAAATLRRCAGDRTWVTGHTALVTADLPRRLLTPGHYAYLKISEGCDRSCTFCAIPGIRGRMQSRSREDLLVEARRLAAAGVRELILISQETTDYGGDRGEMHGLIRLLEGLLDIPAFRWIRLHYLYPTRVTPELIALLASEPRLCRYLDMPLQHCDGAVLKAMGRGGDEQSLRRLVERVRRAVPDITIRTAFITGFPRESGAQFSRLLRFVEAMRFDRVGVFCYSDEEGTPAASLGPKVPRRVAEARRARLMAVQAGIAEEQGRALLGTVQEVMVDGPSPEFPGVQCGRTMAHAPEVDGTVYLRGASVRPGTMVRARIREAYEHDLAADILEAGGESCDTALL
ncbi:MAG: 30S ribosomal protein S12 methylthiotransferase RimO [candidate division NC10 bacterium]|nr:30S ribosomal protein S12 methylthiotransferase RimO [candidate division NC10 bacterium]